MQGLTGTGKLPVDQELCLPLVCPGQYLCFLAVGKRPIQNSHRIDGDIHRCSRVSGLKVRWVMIIVVHLDDDPCETADVRHREQPPPFQQATLSMMWKMSENSLHHTHFE